MPIDAPPQLRTVGSWPLHPKIGSRWTLCLGAVWPMGSECAVLVSIYIYIYVCVCVCVYVKRL